MLRNKRFRGASPETLVTGSPPTGCVGGGRQAGASDSMTFKIKHAVAAAACLIGGAVAAPSQAAIFIALQEAGVNGGAITTVATGSTSAVFNHAYGTFELELLPAPQSVSPMLLGSTTSDNNIRGSGGTLNIYITRNDITGPVPFHYLSSFTSNTLPKKWTMTESTYLSTSNALYTGALLATHTFPTIGTFA